MSDKVKATVSLNIKDSELVYAGPGYQKNSDFPQGVVIGEAKLPCSDSYLEVETSKGLYKVKHEDYE